MTVTKIKAELAKRMKAMELERDALRELEDEVSEQAERMRDACDSLRECIQRLSEVV